MNTRPIVFVSFLLLAGCHKEDAGITITTSSSSSAPVAASVAPSSTAAPSASAEDKDACPADTKPFKPQTSPIGFTWSEAPTLASAPSDGVFLGIANGPAMKIEKVEIWVYKSRAEWDLRVQTEGPGLGPSISFKGAPKAGVTMEDKFGSNRGYFQIPKKGLMADCFRQTTSYNGQNARIVKITRYDEKAEKADGVFVTTWREGFDEKRTFWAAGTFKDARVVIFKS